MVGGWRCAVRECGGVCATTGSESAKPKLCVASSDIPTVRQPLLISQMLCDSTIVYLDRVCSCPYPDIWFWDGTDPVG